MSGFRQGVHTVSWTKTTSQSADPIALTFNDKVQFWIRVMDAGMDYEVKCNSRSFYFTRIKKTLQVFVSDSRFRVYIDIDTWVLVIQVVFSTNHRSDHLAASQSLQLQKHLKSQRVGAPDEAKYECHVNSEPPLKLAICLTVQGGHL